MKRLLLPMLISLILGFSVTIFYYRTVAFMYKRTADVSIETVISLSKMYRETSIELLTFQNKFRIPVTITAYSSRECETDSTPDITASGKKVRSGMVALSRDLETSLGLKFGAHILLEDIGIFVFEDRMHKRKRLQVDIFMDKTEDALEWGVKEGIFVIGRGNDEESGYKRIL